MRLDVHPPVPGALHVEVTSSAGLERRSSSESEKGLVDEPVDLQPPGLGIDERDVVVDQEVVETYRRDVPPERLERHRVIARGELELLEADSLAHRT